MIDGGSGKTEPRRMLVVDEFSSYFGGLNDNLKEQLRSITGVPNSEYLVRNGSVFVFDKLVHVVKARQNTQPDTPLAELALTLLEEATVSAKEAVELWGVVPVPYEKEIGAAEDQGATEKQAGTQYVLHRPFDARLPEAYESDSAVQAALANILVGGIEHGTGDFSYRGQPMKLLEPLDTALPARPAMPEGLPPTRSVYTALGTVEYESGFEPVSEAMFNLVKQTEAVWRDSSARASNDASDRAAYLWAQAKHLRLESLNEPMNEVPEFGQEEFEELRSYYPELSMLTDGSLYDLFDSFQMECRFINGWSANRDDEFLFYLMGKVADRMNDHDTARDVGQWVASALLSGKSLDTALEFGRDANRYNEAIGKLSHRIADAMRFLAADKKATDLRGRPIFTMGDTFRIGRKHNAAQVVVAQQNEADFAR